MITPSLLEIAAQCRHGYGKQRARPEGRREAIKAVGVAAELQSVMFCSTYQQANLLISYLCAGNQVHIVGCRSNPCVSDWQQSGLRSQRHCSDSGNSLRFRHRRHPQAGSLRASRPRAAAHANDALSCVARAGLAAPLHPVHPYGARAVLPPLHVRSAHQLHARRDHE